MLDPVAPPDSVPPSGIHALPTDSSQSAATERERAALRREMCSVLPGLRARALKLCKSPTLADDLLQDTLERALRFEDSFQAGTNLRAWMHQVLFSVFVTRCRKLRRERRALDGLGRDPCGWTHQDAPPVMQSLSPRVAGAVRALPAQFCAVVELVDLGERSYKDAAAVLGVPVGTVMSRLFRARQLLASSLSDGLPSAA